MLSDRGRAAPDSGRQARNQPIQGVAGRWSVSSTGANGGRRNTFSVPFWPFLRTVDNPLLPVLFLYNEHTDPAVKDTTRKYLGMVFSSIVLFSSVTIFVFAQSGAQNCVTRIIMAQIGFVDTPDVNAAVPPEVEEIVDRCVYVYSVSAALSLGASSVAAAVLGAILTNRVLVGHPTIVSAHYEPETNKLVLRFNKPVIAHNPQRMVLLYRHADGMAATVPSRQCGDSGLTLAFATNMKESPTLMELVVCSGAIHPAGFPESDVCTDGRPIHVDVDVLFCDT